MDQFKMLQKNGLHSSTARQSGVEATCCNYLGGSYFVIIQNIIHYEALVYATVVI